MIDMHVHLEKGAYCKEWLEEFITYAEQRGIKEIGLLEHSHRFKEFRDVYDSIVVDTEYGKYQEEWINKRSELHLYQYKDFIKKMRESEFPIQIKFGLEVCYFPDKENEIRECLTGFDWDFVTGSIHWIDGWGFDHPKTKESWQSQDVDKIYEKYYNLMIQLIDSNMFDIIAHPDSIKCFNYYPEKSMELLYKEVARKLKEKDMKAEFNTGLQYRYKHKELGINKELLRELKYYNVELVTASDAHCPQDVGTLIKEANEIVLNYDKK